MIQEIKNTYTKITSKNGNDYNKDYLCGSEFRSSVQIVQSSTCTDIEAILKKLDVEHDNKQESKQSNNKHHIKEGFKSSRLICFHAATKTYNSISEETKTVDLHQGQLATPNADRKCL